MTDIHPGPPGGSKDARIMLFSKFGTPLTSGPLLAAFDRVELAVEHFKGIPDVWGIRVYIWDAEELDSFSHPGWDNMAARNMTIWRDRTITYTREDVTWQRVDSWELEKCDALVPIEDQAKQARLRWLPPITPGVNIPDPEGVN